MADIQELFEALHEARKTVLIGSTPEIDDLAARLRAEGISELAIARDVDNVAPGLFLGNMYTPQACADMP